MDCVGGTDFKDQQETSRGCVRSSEQVMILNPALLSGCVPLVNTNDGLGWSYLTGCWSLGHGEGFNSTLLRAA